MAKSKRDLHNKPFDEGTKEKLAIFKDYLREWLPVFFSRKEIIWNTINIFDFFAGPGADINEYKGTPLIITDELTPYFNTIIKKKLTVNLYFNEFEKAKYEELKTRLLPEDEDLRPYSIEIENFDFLDSFRKQVPNMAKKGCANLLYLDQYGVKHISEDVFKEIINLKTTDFLFFVSSSTIKRFSDHPSINQYIKLNSDDIDKVPSNQIHRKIEEYYKSLIPQNQSYYLSSYSLKKNSNIYGLIFGSGHILGIEKFISTCWKIDKERGEANFDIDQDRIIPGQRDIFTGEVSKPKKVELFERELEEKILNKQLQTDRDIYLYAIDKRFTVSQTNVVIRRLITLRKIAKCTLNLTHKICLSTTKLTTIKVL